MTRNAALDSYPAMIQALVILALVRLTLAALAIL